MHANKNLEDESVQEAMWHIDVDGGLFFLGLWVICSCAAYFKNYPMCTVDGFVASWCH